MKRSFLYIFIALILISILNPSSTFAQNTTVVDGVCYFIYNGTPSQSPSTQAQCNSVGTQHEWLSNTQIINGVKPSIGYSGTSGFQNSPNQPKGESCSWLTDPLSCSVGMLTTMAGKIVAPIFAAIFYIIQKIMALWMGLGGLLLNFVISKTIIEMSTNLASMDGINIAWKTIKDVTNIAFIFLLLYEAILMILSISDVGEIRKLVTKIVIAAVLVNFSLFFTKVLVDASNVVTIGIYEATISSATQGNTTDPLQSTNTGLSGAITNVIGLQKWSDSALDMTDPTGDYGPLVINLMSAVLYFILGFIFLAVSVMFFIRYIVIVVLLALSPVAYMGSALPQLRDTANKWWNSLWGQLLFPPAFMFMMWVALIILSNKNFLLGASLSSTGGITTGNVSAAVNIFFNFALVIGMVIAAMITSKQIGTQGATQIKAMTSWATKATGNAIMGTGAWAGRNSLGRLGNYAANNANLQRAANEGTGASGAAARLALYTSKKARSATFDARNASIPTSAVGDAIRGTVGRTRLGATLGLNDVEFENIPVGSTISGMAGTGTGSKNGFKESQAESAKRVAKRKADAANENEIVQARAIIEKGANASTDKNDKEAVKAIEEMESILAKLSTKQVEAIAASNEKLLESQNFANAISVKQLEAINKSSDVSEGGKSNISKNRLQSINDMHLVETPEYKEASAKAEADRTVAEKELIKNYDDRVKKARTKIKGLVDSEVELMSAEQLGDEAIVSEFRSAQFDSIAKNSQFTSSQKKKIKDIRMNPLLNALDMSRVDDKGNSTYKPDDKKVKDMITKSLSAKDVAGLMSTNITLEIPDPSNPGQMIQQKDRKLLTHPKIIENLSPKLIKRMIDEMNADDISTLREAVDNEINKYKGPDGKLIASTPGKLKKLSTWLGKEEASDFE